MITINDIKNWSKPHGTGLGGKQTIIENENLVVSIVGGRQGLYGDFENDFELAIISTQSRDFLTREFLPELNDDVVAYASSQKIEEIVNRVFTDENFQVR